MTKELPGFLANRLMEAVWREALHLVANDMATVEEIEAAMRYGPVPKSVAVGMPRTATSRVMRNRSPWTRTGTWVPCP